MRELKKSSSVWVHEEIQQDKFAWQEGYSAFTVSTSALSRVTAYITNQREHHRVKSFREELVEMLDRAATPDALRDPGLMAFMPSASDP